MSAQPIPQPEQDVDVVQHPTLGPLKFPKAMPFDQRNQMIDKMEKESSPNAGFAQPSGSGIVPEKSLSGLASTAALGVGNILKIPQAVEGAKQLSEDVPQIPNRIRANVSEAMGPRMHPISAPVGEPAIPGWLMPSFAGGAGVQTIKDLPTLESTGKMFQTVEDAAKEAGQNVIPSQRTMDLANRANELKQASGTTIPSPIRAFARNTIPSRANPGPLPPPSFQNARDLYSASTNLSRTEKMNMGGKMPGVMKQFTKSLDSDIRAAANAIGQGETYANAMKQYPLAKGIEQLKEATPGALVKIAKYGSAVLGAGTLSKIGYEIGKQFYK